MDFNIPLTARPVVLYVYYDFTVITHGLVQKADMMKTHYRTCSLCEAMCGLQIEHEGEQIISVKGNPDDILSFGHICPKGVAIQDLHSDPDRLRAPMKRIGDSWEEISWEEALDTTAKRLVAVQNDFGKDAVASYWGNPIVHNFGALMSAAKFRRTLKTRNNYTAASVDVLPSELVQYLMYGSQFLYTIPDVDRTDFMLILGANPVVSNGSLWSAGDIKRRMKDLTARGGKIILIDPRRTESAKLANRHHFIRPGTDAVFLLAILHIIFKKGLIKPGHLTKILKGWERIETIAHSFSLSEASDITGIAANDIEQIAIDFATAERAICYGRMGTSTQVFGGLCQWLIQVLNIATGNLDREGGLMFASPAFDLPALASRGSYNKFKSRVRGLPETSGSLPSAALAEEMLTPGPGQIKAFICNAGNPVLTIPNGKQLETALESLDFMVSIDFYINETSAKAHIILPPTGPLEHSNFDVLFNLLAVRNIVKYSEAMIKPDDNSKDDWAIYDGLIKRMKGLKGRKSSPSARFWSALVKQFPYLGSAEFMLDLALRKGPYGKGFMPFRKGLSLSRLRRAPHGIDLGPLKPRLPERLFTKDKMINVAPSVYINDIKRLKEESLSACKQDVKPLLLIGRRHKRSNNSWMHNSHRMIKGKDRCTAMIHPRDAEHHQVENGQNITVKSRTGSIRVKAEISDEISPGVVSIPHGWGHMRPGTKLSIARQMPGVSVNDITDEMAIDEISGTAAVNGIPVQIIPN